MIIRVKEIDLLLSNFKEIKSYDVGVREAENLPVKGTISRISKFDKLPLCS